MGAWGYFDDSNDNFLDAMANLVHYMMERDPVAVQDLAQIDPNTNYDDVWEYEQKWIQENARMVGDQCGFDGNEAIGAMMHLAEVGSGYRFRGRQAVPNQRKMYCHPVLAGYAKAQILYLLENPQVIREEGWGSFDARVEALRIELKIAETMLNTPPELHYTVIAAPDIPNL
jgi:hypothetical protein